MRITLSLRLTIERRAERNVDRPPHVDEKSGTWVERGDSHDYDVEPRVVGFAPRPS